LYECIQNKESAHCKLRKKYKEKEVKLCCMDSDPLMENHSPSLTVEAARLLVAIIRNSIQKSKGRRWNFEDSLGSVSS
jgi:hypothetical protein